MKYIEPANMCKSGDIIGSHIDLDQGTIQFYKNGQALGVAIQEGNKFRKGKLYPFVQLYKCQISVYQPSFSGSGAAP